MQVQQDSANAVQHPSGRKCCPRSVNEPATMHFNRACRPDAPHSKLHTPNWFVSSLMLDRALDAILRRVKKFDRSHDIPYLAGYSTDGKTIYICRRASPGAAGPSKSTASSSCTRKSRRP